MLKVLQRNEHRPNCRAIVAVQEGRWDYPWAAGDLEWRDSAGQWRGRTTQWMKLPCNDPSCSAYALVGVDSILLAVQESSGVSSA
jgi:hypothetical protein